MRCGKLLAETSPAMLLMKFQCPSLEEAFLILSRQQKENRDKGIPEVEAEEPDGPEEVTTHTAPSSQNDLRSSTDVSNQSTTPSTLYNCNSLALSRRRANSHVSVAVNQIFVPLWIDRRDGRPAPVDAGFFIWTFWRSCGKYG